jgi:hypothetical protein
MKKLYIMLMFVAAAIFAGNNALAKCKGNDLTTDSLGRTHCCNCNDKDRVCFEIHSGGKWIPSAVAGREIKCKKGLDNRWADERNGGWCTGEEAKSVTGSQIVIRETSNCWERRGPAGLVNISNTCVPVPQETGTVQGDQWFPLDCAIELPTKCTGGGCVIWNGQCMPICEYSMISEASDATSMTISAPQAEESSESTSTPKPEPVRFTIVYTHASNTADTRRTTKTFDANGATVQCNNETFLDPSVGTQKACYLLTSPGGIEKLTRLAVEGGNISIPRCATFPCTIQGLEGVITLTAPDKK